VNEDYLLFKIGACLMSFIRVLHALTRLLGSSS